MKEIFNEIIESIENEDIRRFAEKCIETIPKYFWEVPASSSFKYHPAYACEVPLGLAKHTVAVARFINHMFNIESVAEQFPSRARDLIRVAALMHDSRKSGTQEDYEKNKYTKFDHPLQAAEIVRTVTGIIPENEVKFCASLIESHMGAFNTNKLSTIVLPKPETPAQIILHIADYLASRKDIEIKFGSAAPEVGPCPPATLESWVVPFGKHRGKTIPQIKEEDPGYIAWAKNNIEKEPMHSLLEQI